MKKSIYNLLYGGKVFGKIYDYIMIITILISIIPLTTISSYPVYGLIDAITTILFIIDYIFRWYTSDLLLHKGKQSYLRYPFTGMALIDLFSILPAFNLFNPAFKVARLVRIIKIFRLFKVLRYSNKLIAFFRILSKERSVLLAVLFLAIFYIFTTALIMFNVEPKINPTTGEATFNSFFDALYWSTITLTTVGYGDLCPVTNSGRIISMLSSLFGVAVIALPSGVITASYIEELKNQKKDNNG